MRFAKTSIAPNRDGPRLGGDFAGVTVRSYGPNALRVAWPANYDRDNERLTYRVYRDNVLIHEKTADSRFYNQPNLSFLDTTVTPGQTYTYRVRASDPFNNVMWSSYVPGTAGSGNRALALPADGAVRRPEGVLVLRRHLWHRTGRSGRAMTTPTAAARSRWAQPEPSSASPVTSFSFSGSGSNSAVNNTTSQISMDYFSTELWLKTTSNNGGQLDRLRRLLQRRQLLQRPAHLHDQQRSGVLCGPAQAARPEAVNSSGTYRDGNWHHVVGTMSGEGMALYVDGTRVGFDPLTKTGLQFNSRVGYWRIGGDPLSSAYPNRPSSNYLAGQIDEVATYPVALTAEQIANHYQLGANGVAPNELPSASFTSSVNTLTATFDASGSSDPDGTLVGYAWNFGNGTTGTGVNPSVTYAAAGTYPISLTVTDNRGGKATATGSVTVARAANVKPTAAFTFDSTDLTLSVDGSTSSDPTAPSRLRVGLR